MTIIRKSLSHLKEQNMSYMQHFFQSFTFSLTLQSASFKAMVHSFIPSAFENSTTELKNELKKKLE